MKTSTQGLSSGSDGVERFVETREVHLVSNVWCAFTVAAAGARAWTIIAVTTAIITVTTTIITVTTAIITVTTTIRRLAVAVRRSETTPTTTSSATATTTDISTSTTRVVCKADVNTQQVLVLSMVCIVFLQYNLFHSKQVVAECNNKHGTINSSNRDQNIPDSILLGSFDLEQVVFLH